jgi:Autotransporter beta-domain.
LNLGISVDQSQSIIDVAGLAQRGRIDLTQVGAIAGYENGPWNINATLVRGFGDVHSSRVDVGGASTAAYQAGLWAAMAELNYYWALPDNTRLVPKSPSTGCEPAPMPSPRSAARRPLRARPSPPAASAC